ncbi:MAG: carboxymuconolactone decarboxylase family protein [Acetobacteraceae bacterium]
MARLPDLSSDTMTPEQRRVHDAIVAGPRGVVEGPLRVWLHNPELAERAQALGAFCRYGSSLPARLSELAILLTGAHWRAGFEWHVHAPIAVKAGLDPAAVEAIRVGRDPGFAAEDTAAVFAFATELLRTRSVGEATFARARAALGPVGVVDLVAILGYYGFISMTINAFAVPLPEGAAEPFTE